MEAVAKARFQRISPQKARLMADAIRGLRVGEALSKLQFTRPWPMRPSARELMWTPCI
jgi:large subunit ribosomal protein L22